MAAILVHSPIPVPSVGPPICNITRMMRTPRPFSATDIIAKNPNGSRLISTIKVAEQTSTIVGDDDETKGPLYSKTAAQLKAELHGALQGINRGIFGVPAEKKTQIEDLVRLLESQNPTPDPTQNLEKVAGCWKLVYRQSGFLDQREQSLGCAISSVCRIFSK